MVARRGAADIADPPVDPNLPPLEPDQDAPYERLRHRDDDARPSSPTAAAWPATPARVPGPRLRRCVHVEALERAEAAGDQLTLRFLRGIARPHCEYDVLESES